ERAMRFAGVDIELLREVHELSARGIEIAGERQRVIGAEIELLSDRLRHAREDTEVELVAVVRDDDVFATELTELGPDVLEVRCGLEVRRVKRVRRRRGGGD